MSRAVEILDRLLEPVGRALTPDVARKLLDLRADPQVQQRVEFLADRNTEGLLTAAEQEEYEALVRAGELIGVLQAKATALLSGSSAA